MTIWKKAVSTAASAALLASLLATVAAPAASAAVTLGPSTGPTTGGTLVSISGAGAGTFVSGSTVNLCGTTVQATSIAPDGTALTFLTPVCAAAGLYAVTTSPAVIGLPGFFYTVAAYAPPTITPATGKDATVIVINTPGQTLPVAPVSVTMGGVTTAATIRNGDNQVTLAVPTGACTATGTIAVSITTIVGLPGFGCVVGSTYTIVPNTGPQAGGTVVQMSGVAASFNQSCRVTLAGVALGVSIVPTSVAADGSKLTFVVPADNAGATAAAHAVSVGGGDSGCTAGTAGNFTYTTAGGTTGINPATGSTDGGTTIQLTYSTGGFTGATQIIWTGAAGSTAPATLTPTTVAADGKSLTFVSPDQSTTTPAVNFINPITITTTTPASQTFTFNYAAAAASPVVSSVSPNTGSRAGGNTVTITGLNFVSGATVAFGAAAATGVTFVSATSLTAVVPAGVGTVPVTVANPDGQSAQLVSAYTYTDTGYVCGNGSALNVTTTGPFSTSTKVPALNQYVTFAMGCGVAAAGQVITIQRAVKNSSGVWSAFTAYTSRVANSGGTVYYYVRSSSAAWWSFRASIASVVSPARQAHWQ